jgi:tight adherence protein B
MSHQFITVFTALLVIGALILLMFGVRQSRARAATPEMEDRLDRYALGIPEESTGDQASATAVVTDRIDKAVKGSSFAEKTQTALSRADLKMTVGEFLAIRGGVAALLFIVGLVLGARAGGAVGILFGIVFALVGWIIPAFYLKFKAKRRQKKFVNQLGDTIGLMANSLRAGYSLLQTMELISRETPAPMCDEFRRVVREVGLGMTPQAALNNLVRRIPSEDLDLMVSAINIQHEIGGNLGQILDVIGEVIRERVRIQGEIGVLTAQQQLSGNIITAMPLFLAFILFLLNPEYMMGVFVWPWVCIPIGAFIMLLMGYFVMRKIVAIEV